MILTLWTGPRLGLPASKRLLNANNPVIFEAIINHDTKIQDFAVAMILAATVCDQIRNLMPQDSAALLERVGRNLDALDMARKENRNDE